VDEYLTDKEQVERIRLWWRDNGWFLIGGIALGALGLFGYQQFNAYQDRRGEEAAALYQALKEATEQQNAVEATATLARLRSEYSSSAYTPQAGLLVASTLLVAAPERAAEELRTVMDETVDSDPELSMIARLRLARVLAYREQYDEALKLLSVSEPGKFAGRVNEVKGDLQAAQGHVEEARAAYLAAMVANGSELLDRNFLQMKLNDLPGGDDSSDATAPPSAGATVPEASPTTEGESPAAGSPNAAAAPAAGEGA
jgi:predicted negative regulator of RcsB-dependent stress response